MENPYLFYRISTSLMVIREKNYQFDADYFFITNKLSLVDAFKFIGKFYNFGNKFGIGKGNRVSLNTIMKELRDYSIVNIF